MTVHTLIVLPLEKQDSPNTHKGCPGNDTKYADCTPFRKVRPPLTHTRGVQDMTVHTLIVLPLEKQDSPNTHKGCPGNDTKYADCTPFRKERPPPNTHKGCPGYDSTYADCTPFRETRLPQHTQGISW